MDTGCSDNLLSTKVFQQMKTVMRMETQKDATHAVLANGSKMALQGKVTLTLNLGGGWSARKPSSSAPLKKKSYREWTTS